MTLLCQRVGCSNRIRQLTREEKLKVAGKVRTPERSINTPASSPCNLKMLCLVFFIQQCWMCDHITEHIGGNVFHYCIWLSKPLNSAGFDNWNFLSVEGPQKVKCPQFQSWTSWAHVLYIINVGACGDIKRSIIIVLWQITKTRFNLQTRRNHTGVIAPVN